MTVQGSRTEREVTESATLRPDQPKLIGARSTHSNAIVQHAVVARSAAVTMVRTAGVAVVAAWEAMVEEGAAAEVSEAVVVVFEEAVAGADGIIGAIP
jgi:hypothetical protein